MKNVHIYFHKAKTQDAVAFHEEQHKRDKGGKFTAGGGNAEHHKAEAAKHLSASEHTSTTTAKAGSKEESRVLAAHHHSNAAYHLEQAAKYTTSSLAHKKNMQHAQTQADLAAKHAASLGPSAGTTLKSNTKLTNGNTLASLGGGKFNVYPPSKPGERVKPIVTSITMEELKARPHLGKVPASAASGVSSGAKDPHVKGMVKDLHNRVKSLRAGDYTKGQEVHTSHSYIPKKGTYLGPGDNPKTHHRIKLGNQILDIPHHNVHPSRTEASLEVKAEHSKVLQETGAAAASPRVP